MTKNKTLETTIIHIKNASNPRYPCKILNQNRLQKKCYKAYIIKPIKFQKNPHQNAIKLNSIMYLTSNKQYIHSLPYPTTLPNILILGYISSQYVILLIFHRNITGVLYPH